MSTNTLSRRTFLKVGTMSAAAAFTLSLTGYALAASDWQMTVNHLDKNSANKLLRICKKIYPHLQIDDVFYAACVESIDGKIGSNEALKQQILTGIESLDQTSDMNFESLSTEQQVAALTAIESTPFFQSIRGDMVVSLYNNPKIWQKFGYEGPSFSKGGYLIRGFDDINWLPKSEGEA